MRIFEIQSKPTNDKLEWIKSNFVTAYGNSLTDDMLLENNDGTFSFLDTTVHGISSLSAIGGSNVPPIITSLPVKFKEVHGAFCVNKMGLTTLHGCPDVVHGHFLAANNKIITLEGGPKIVKYAYSVRGAKLRNFDYLPSECNTFRFDGVRNLPYLRLFKIENLESIDIKNNHTLSKLLNNILTDKTLNVQQKILLAKRKLTELGLKGNAKL